MVDQVGFLPLVANRWTPFRTTLAFIGENFLAGGGTGLAMQVRATPDASGPPLINLTIQPSPVQGVQTIDYAGDTIANHIAADRIDAVPDGYALTDVVDISVVEIRIDEATLEALPFPAERGDDLPLAWDLHVTLAGSIKERWLEGPFTVHAGVTQ